MTPVDGMVAGRELDARVAEKVMAWTRSMTQYGEFLRDAEHGVAPLFGVIRGNLPFYSTDIAAAWSVVEELTRPGLQFMSDFMVQRNGQRRYFAQFLAEGLTDGLHNEWIEAETMPLAICCAALAAVESKEILK